MKVICRVQNVSTATIGSPLTYVTVDITLDIRGKSLYVWSSEDGLSCTINRPLYIYIIRVSARQESCLSDNGPV